MHDSEPALLSEPISDFVKTHCMTCAAGATVTRVNTGGKATYCLLLRVWMTDKRGRDRISACDRYELRDDKT